MKWFKHDTSTRRDDKIFVLLEKHGLQGYGFFWIVLEECYSAEESGFQISVTEVWCKRLAKELNLSDDRTIYRLLDTLAELGLIDNQLWQERTVYPPGIQKRADAYSKTKVDAAERKRKEREREREKALKSLQPVTPMSRVTPCDIGNVTLSDPETDLDPKTNTDPERASIPETRTHAQVSSFATPKPTQKPIIKSAAKIPIEPVHQNPEQAIEVKAEISSVPKAQDQAPYVPQFSDERIDECDQGLASVAIVPASHGISRMEARLRAGGAERPWEHDSIARRAFVEYIANYQKRPGETLERSRMIAVRIVQKAGSAVPGQDEFDRVAGYWELFKENAARSVVAEQVTGANKLPSNLVQFFAERDVKIARDYAERQQREVAHAV